jgi:hypothetical protein
MPTTWYIARDGKQHGPITAVEFSKLVELGHLKPTDLVWHDGAADWMPATQFLDPPPAIARRQPAPTGGAELRRAEPQHADDRPGWFARFRVGAIILSAAVAVLIGVMAKFATTGVLDILFRPKVDRSVIERQLLGDPKLKWLKVLQERQPTTYSSFMSALTVRLERKEPLEDSINYLRTTLIEPIYAANAPYLDDEAMTRYIYLVADQMELFSKTNPRLCVRMFRGQPVGDVRTYLTETLLAQEQQLLEDALLVDKTKARRRYTQAEQAKFMEGILAKLTRQLGDLVRLIDPDTPADGRERDVCTLGAALFREIGALPGPSSAALMRTILSAPK